MNIRRNGSLVFVPVVVCHYDRAIKGPCPRMSRICSCHALADISGGVGESGVVWTLFWCRVWWCDITYAPTCIICCSFIRLSSSPSKSGPSEAPAAPSLR
jgi:hypothetical protein